MYETNQLVQFSHFPQLLKLIILGCFVFDSLPGIAQDKELPLRISYDQLSKELSVNPLPFYEAYKNQDVHVFLYSPRGTDKQEPHNRDELYLVIQGSGQFLRGSKTQDFKTGDVLMAKAHEEHRFLNFTPDLAVWVVFFGPAKEKRP